MEKTKMGLSVGLMCAFIYLIGEIVIDGGVQGMALLGIMAAFLLKTEENASVRKTVMFVVTLILALEVARVAIYIIPNFMSAINVGDWESNQGPYKFFKIFNSIFGMLYALAKLAVRVLLAALAIFGFFGRPLKLRFLDKFVEKAE